MFLLFEAMKKLLLALVLLFSIQSFSQEYIPMLQDGNKWGVVFCSWGECGGVRITEIIGEEAINGKVYKQLNSETCLLREENGIVYVLNDDLSEDVLLDFTLEVGDSFFPDDIRDNCLNMQISLPVEFRVVDIQTATILGEDRKVLYIDYFDNGSSLGFGEVWIEGIGSTLAIGPGGWEFDNGQSVVCFTNNGQNVLVFDDMITETEDPCIKTFGLSELVLDQIVLSPNPVSEISTLTIPLEIPTAQFRLFDLNGKKLLVEHISEKNTTIDFSSLQGGMYFYQIYSENEVIATKKLIIR